MNDILICYTRGLVFTGDLNKDIFAFFSLDYDLRTLNHTLEVADEANRIDDLYEIDPSKVVSAALLHDISNVIPISTMLEVAKHLSIEVFEQEPKHDRTVHQQLSKYMAQDSFRITDKEIFNAIESH